MMSLHRVAVLIVVLAISAGDASAASQKDIDNAIQRGVAFLKPAFSVGVGQGGVNGVGGNGIGPTALAGIALLGAKVPASDPVIQTIALSVRNAAYTETATYQLSLCLIFLDQLENPADAPLIQILGVRLLTGQSSKGGWGYPCVGTVSNQDDQWLRSVVKSHDLVAGGGAPKAPAPATPGHKPAAKLNADIERYYGVIWGKRELVPSDDNSNTQFATLAIWLARKYGVPVDSALDMVDRRFMASQFESGIWTYNGNSSGSSESPAMTCAGLIGLSIGVGRREESRLKAEQARKEKEAAARPGKAQDPFFTPPAKSDAPDGKKAPPKRPPDERDMAVSRGMAALGRYLTGAQARGSEDELYFLWSLERVGVIYGVDKIGGVDWYAVGSDQLVRKQTAAGSWTGTYGAEVSTSFALLFLTKANVARDLSSKIKPEAGNELRAGTGPGAAATSGSVGAGPKPAAPDLTPGPSPAPLPSAKTDESTRLATELVSVPATDWLRTLERVRDAKGADYTKALVVAIPKLGGDRQKDARGALAERLTRMTAETLRGMMKGDEVELRRGAVLAAAMKDDKSHVPDLIDRLTDDNDGVSRAARAGLKSLTGEDFGPATGATRAERKTAADVWRTWWSKQKK